MSIPKSDILVEEIISSNPSQYKLKHCPICKNTIFENEFILQDFQVQSCKTCRLQLLNPQPSEEVLNAIYSAEYFLTGYSQAAVQLVSEMKQATAILYLDMLINYSGYTSGKLLEVGCGNGDFLVEAQSRGFEV